MKFIKKINAPYDEHTTIFVFDDTIEVNGHDYHLCIEQWNKRQVSPLFYMDDEFHTIETEYIPNITFHTAWELVFNNQ